MWCFCCYDFLACLYGKISACSCVMLQEDAATLSWQRLAGGARHLRICFAVNSFPDNIT